MSELSILLFLGLVLPVFSENVLVKMCFADVCRPKCCPFGEHFNSTSNQCQMNVMVPGKSHTGGGNFSICPRGEWHLDFKENFNSSLKYQCAEMVTYGSQLIQKNLFCPKPAKISITKCFGPKTIYSRRQHDFRMFDFNKSVHWPPVHSSVSNQLIHYSAQDFHVNDEFFQCPNGYSSRSSSYFTLFDDGTMETVGMAYKFKPGNFCIANLFHPTNFFVRYCVQGPPIFIDTVPSCCPWGFRVNYHTLECDPVITGSEIIHQNANGHNNPPNFHIRSGFVPSCEIYVLDNSDDLPNGSVYVPGFPEGSRVFEEHCTAYFSYFSYFSLQGVLDGLYIEDLICIADDLLSEMKLAKSIHAYIYFTSFIFPISTFVVYARIPELQNITGANVMCFVASLASTYVSFGIMNLGLDLPKGGCIALGIISTITFLASFTWLNVISFDTWSAVRLRRRDLQHVPRIGVRFLMYSVYAWGVPILIVGIGAILDNIGDLHPKVVRPRFGGPSCWMSGEYKSRMAYLHGPIAAILSINILLFILTAVCICWIGGNAASTPKTRRQKRRALLFFSISTLLMGGRWCIYVLFADTIFYYGYLLDGINFLTAVFIFIFFVCKRNVLILLRKKMQFKYTD